MWLYASAGLLFTLCLQVMQTQQKPLGKAPLPVSNTTIQLLDNATIAEMTSLCQRWLIKYRWLTQTGCSYNQA